MEQTGKYKLNKPGDNDYGDVAALNENADIIEAALTAGEAALVAHTASRDNPHGVTAAQVGAAAAGHQHSAADVGADPAGSAQTVRNELNWHAGRVDNPHGVTAAQVGACTAAEVLALLKSAKGRQGISTFEQLITGRFI